MKKFVLLLFLCFGLNCLGQHEVAQDTFSVYSEWQLTLEVKYRHNVNNAYVYKKYDADEATTFYHIAISKIGMKYHYALYKTERNGKKYIAQLIREEDETRVGGTLSYYRNGNNLYRMRFDKKGAIISYHAEKLENGSFVIEKPFLSGKKSEGYTPYPTVLNTDGYMYVLTRNIPQKKGTVKLNIVKLSADNLFSGAVEKYECTVPATVHARYSHGIVNGELITIGSYTKGGNTVVHTISEQNGAFVESTLQLPFSDNGYLGLLIDSTKMNNRYHLVLCTYVPKKGLDLRLIE